MVSNVIPFLFYKKNTIMINLIDSEITKKNSEISNVKNDTLKKVKKLIDSYGFHYDKDDLYPTQFIIKTKYFELILNIDENKPMYSYDKEITYSINEKPLFKKLNRWGKYFFEFYDSFELSLFDEKLDIDMLNDYYIGYKQFIIIKSKLSEVIDLLNQMGVSVFNIETEIQNLENQKESILKNKMNDFINHTINFGGEYELQTYTLYCYNHNTKTESLMNHSDSYTLSYYDEDLGKVKRVVDKIIVGDKIKGTSSYICDTFIRKDNDNPFEFELLSENCVVTKNQLVEWLKNGWKYNNKTVIERTEQSLKDEKKYSIKEGILN